MVMKKDLVDAKAGLKTQRSGPGREKRVRRAGEPWNMKRIEVLVSFLIRLSILHLHLHLQIPYLTAFFPTHPLHYISALDSGSEASWYVAKVAVQEFSSYSHLCKLVTHCSWLCDKIPCLGPLLNEEEIIVATFSIDSVWHFRLVLSDQKVKCCSRSKSNGLRLQIQKYPKPNHYFICCGCKIWNK